MGHGVVSAARKAGVEHFVQFSVTHPQLEPLLNHQAELAVEREVLLSRMPFTILQPMHYGKGGEAMTRTIWRSKPKPLVNVGVLLHRQ